MTLRLRALFAGLCAAAVLSGCYTSTSSLSRIDANRSLYESWPLPVQEAVLDQRVIPGMDEDMVRMAVGEPAEISTRPNPRTRAVEDVWIYRKKGSGGGGGALRNTSISVGGGTGGVYVGGGAPISLGGGGGNSDLPAEEHVVIFEKGKVKSSTLGPMQ